MKFLLFPLILFSNIVLSQSIINYERTYSDTLPEKFKLNIPTLRSHIYNGIPSYYKEEEKYKRMSYKFADIQAYHISNLLHNGNVYSDWDELETYLNDVLQKVLPEELKNDSVIHAYIYKDGYLNAFMTPSGQFFNNIFILSRIGDEASLAAVIAHELAHYYKQHSLQSFIQNELGNFDYGLIDTKKREHFSVLLELEADSLAMLWLKNSNYNIAGFFKTYRIMQREEEKLLSRLEDKWELKEQTHPLSKKRVENFMNFYKKNKDYEGELFLIDKEKFHKFKKESKKESLTFLLNDFEYYECLELAFKFHLMDPDNLDYVYYLMESIRRIGYTDTEIWKENFITNRYYDTVRVDGVRKKKKVKRDLFEKLDFSLLPITQEEAKYIKARFYWEGEKKFKTYNEAYEFYYKVGKALNCKECVLSYALSITRNKENRDKFLKEYLSFENIKYKKYAENLINETVSNKLSNNKLLVFNEFDTYIKQGKEKIPIRRLTTDSINLISAIFDSVKTSFPNRIPIFLPDLKNYNLNEYRLLLELEYFSFMYLKSKGEKTKLHILDPRYIELFYKYDVNEIEFINCAYYESRKIENTIEAYKQIINTSYQELFSSPKKTKSFEIIITSLREIKNRKMKIKYYGDDNILKFKDPSYNQIIELLKNKIKEKEKKAYDADVRYQKGW